MSFNQSLSYRFVEGPNVNSSLSFEGQTVTFKVAVDGNEAEGTWTINFEEKSLAFSSIIHAGAHAVCIISCLGISVGKPLLECLLRSRSLADVEKCLKDKAVGALADAALCIAHCLNIIP
jgi:hypothetical protein